MDARDGAWNAFHDALPEGWNVGRLSHDPGRHAWTIVARSPQPVRRRGAPESLEGAGEDEIAVLTYLALALEAQRADAKRADIRQRGRLAYLQAAGGIAAVAGSWTDRRGAGAGHRAAARSALERQGSVPSGNTSTGNSLAAVRHQPGTIARSIGRHAVTANEEVGPALLMAS